MSNPLCDNSGMNLSRLIITFPIPDLRVSDSTSTPDSPTLLKIPASFSLRQNSLFFLCSFRARVHHLAATFLWAKKNLPC